MFNPLPLIFEASARINPPIKAVLDFLRSLNVPLNLSILLLSIDELSTYRKFSKHVFGKYTQHHAHIHWKRDMNNNKMERFNGTFRDLKKSNTALIGGLILAEASKIKGNGLNK